jgi:Zn-finger in ubiquitin-hydrolases and other protein
MITDELICAHIKAVKKIKQADKYECEECVKTNDNWLHLRTCQECGVTLCCDSSPNQHASKHAHIAGHPVIASAEPDESWMYCYFDYSYYEY